MDEVLLRCIDEALGRWTGPGERLLVAASAGVDSTVLAVALDELAPAHRLECVLAHVDHGLRGAASEADARAAQRLADKLGWRFRLARVAVEAERQQRSGRERLTLQEAARSLRYSALETLRQSEACDRIVTAHHMDDQVETVLMRLFRGSGPEGLGGIPERSADGLLLRPMLEVSREQIEAFARSRDLEWREDASNTSRDYTRNRLRHDFIPELRRAFNPRLLRVISNMAETQRRENEWTAELVAEACDRCIRGEQGEVVLAGEGWAEMPLALARRVAKSAWLKVDSGRDVSRVHLDRMIAFMARGKRVQGGRQIELPGGLRLVRAGDAFRLKRDEVAGSADGG